MPFSLNKNGVVSDLQAALPDAMTQALRNANPNNGEVADGQLMGQILDYKLKQADPGNIIELNAQVNNGNPDGSKTFVLTIREQSTKPVTSPTARPWTPDVGPIKGLGTQAAPEEGVKHEQNVGTSPTGPV